MPDLTKLQLYSGTPAFHNKNVYTGSVIIGTDLIPESGLIIRSFTLPLSEAPSLLEFTWSSPDSIAAMHDFSSAPSGSWHHPDHVYGVKQNVTPTSLGGTEIFIWLPTYRVLGSNVIIDMQATVQYIDTFTPQHSITLNYKITDYIAMDSV